MTRNDGGRMQPIISNEPTTLQPVMTYTQQSILDDQPDGVEHAPDDENVRHNGE